MSDRYILTADEAIACLPEGDNVHTMIANGIMIGADWTREAVIAHIREHGAQLGGPVATRMRHGICLDPRRRLFCATDAEALAALEAKIAAEPDEVTP